MKLFDRSTLAMAILAIAGMAQAQPLAGPGLGAALRQGGYVLVVRHTHAPTQPPSSAAAEPGNLALERQLDALGRQEAATFGQGVRDLGLPVGEVMSSPAFRAVQTVQHAGLPAPRTVEPLGDGGHSMSGIGADSALWLRRAAATPPRPGADTILVTHQPNIAAAFSLTDVAEGEALVFKPGGETPELVARIKPADWPALR